MAPKTRATHLTPDSGTSTAIDNLTEPMGEIKARPREGSRTRGEDVVDPTYALHLATKTPENVFLFVPNLIGYARIITAAAALIIMPKYPRVCTMVYFVSCMLDVADGQAARKLGQTSKFGAVLDMVTDRCTTACLLCFLSATFPTYSLLFMFLITLDFSSHYMHMYASLTTGAKSHKEMHGEVSQILEWYYTNRIVLFILCFGNETAFVCAYLHAFIKTEIHSSWPLSAFINPSTLQASVPTLVWWFLSASWPVMIGIPMGVLCFVKQVINMVQFWKASKILVGVDIAERLAIKEAEERKGRGE